MALVRVAEICGVDYEQLLTEIREIANEQAEAVRAREVGEELREIQDERKERNG